MAQGADLGLKLGLAAFLAALVAPGLPVLNLVFGVLAVASAALLLGDARHRAPAQLRLSQAAVALVAVGFLALIVSVNLAFRAPGASSAVWVAFAGDVALAAGLYLAPQHLAASRSRTLLGLAFGASIALSGIVAVLASQGSSDRLVAAVSAKGLPFILFAWAYATILGRLRREGKPTDPWSLDRKS